MHTPLRFVVLALGALVCACSTNAQNPAPDLAVNPASSRPEIDPALPTIFVAGDSTAARTNSTTSQGWAVPFADYFDTSKVNIVNRARGGRSSRTFVTEGLWDQLLEDVKAGDIVLIQFGHNDGGAINAEPAGSNRPLRARGSLPGLGSEAVGIDNLVTKRHEVVRTYGWYMRKMISDVRAKQAQPVVLSLTLRNIWRDGRIERGSGLYGGWAYEIAKEAGVPFFDLSHAVADRFEDLGEGAVKAFYERDHTHFNLAGADLHAATVVSGLRGLRPSPIEALLSEKGKGIEADKLAWLNLPRPADPRLPNVFLVGDSTVRNGRGDGSNREWGWGDFVHAWFDTERVNVVNRAVGGLSSRTYLTQGHWDLVMRMLKPGDFVVMQFGHNDAAPLNDDRRARGTIKGVGEETETIDNMLTGKSEIVYSYGGYLRRFVSDARAKGATPIVCSLVPRKIWKDGAIVRAKEGYAGWAEQVARMEGVAFLDLNERIALRYEALGEEAVDELFADAHTHTSRAGAEMNAGVVAAALRDLSEHPIQTFLAPVRP
jgi:lysophospholipase L1-like esterase